MAVLIPNPAPRATRVEDCAFPNLRRRQAWRLVIGLWLALAYLGLGEVRGEVVSREYPLKAVFLLNFAHYTEWPTNAFPTPDLPFVIGVLGDDPFGKLLDDAVRDEMLNGRKIVVERYRRVEEIKTCHILYIGQSESRRIPKNLADLKGRPILTVSDNENSAYQDACVRFRMENNKIRLRMNTDALKAANLIMSSKLLRAAELVTGQSN